MKNLLRFITCGSVDDGKSTLIGHMIYEANLIYADQAKAIEQIKINDSIDYSLLLDGLMDERAQGITIDVAYRYFNTDKRTFILADTPGHQQYTRNMAVGASFADLAIILIDASKGILPQTKRHINITKMMGIKDYVVAVNKMDTVDYQEAAFAKIVSEVKNISLLNDVHSLQIIPLSATKGDNVISLSDKTPYYKGPSLMEWLETIETQKKTLNEDFYMPVQRVQRGDNGSRYLQGEILSGKVSVSDAIVVYPSLIETKIKSIYRGFESLNTAQLGDPVSIQLATEVDISRGDVVSNRALPVVNSFDCDFLWLDRNQFDPEKEYYLRVHTKRTLCRLNTIQLKVVEDRTEETTDIGMNDIFTAKVETLNDVVALPFVESKGLGGLILIDPITNATVAVGTISTVNENPRNLTKYDFSITPKLRAELKNQTAMTIWFTGLSGSGKSYTSDLLEKTLYQEGFHTMTLDGDSLRSTINQDLGFTIEDRIKNIRRTAQIAKILNDAGIIVLVSLISPLKEERAEAKRIIGDNKFIEAFVDTPLELCMERDTKGLYQKALKGEITNFTGVDSPYEAPENPDIVIQPSDDIIQKIKLIVELMKKGEH